MKTLRLFLFTLVLALASTSITPAARAQDDDQGGTPSFDYFYNNLAPYGDWVQVEGYGYCWQPYGVDENWQPYTDGYWAYTDGGWTWVSYEDFGWATYHYGRWTRVDELGWVWVPGYEWAPAWVSWRKSPHDDYVGWAPLPPEARFRPGIGISVWVDTAYDIGPGYYNFCRTRDFGAPYMAPVIIDRSQNVTFINNTVNITNITVNHNNIFNGGPNYRMIQHNVDPARPIHAFQLVRQTDPNYFRHNGNLAQAHGNQLFVGAPNIVAPKQPFTPPKPVKTFDKPKFDKGWNKIHDPAQIQQAQAAMRAQNKGIKIDHPATPVTAQQLAVIPKGPAAGQPTPPVTGGQPTPPPNGGKGKFQKGQFNPAVQQPVNPAVTGQPTPPVATPAGTPIGKGKFHKGQQPPVNPAVNPAVQQPVNPAVVPPVQPVATPVPTPPGKGKFQKNQQLTPFNPAAQQPNGAVQPTPPPSTPAGNGKFHKGFQTPPNGAGQPPVNGAAQTPPVQNNNAALLKQQQLHQQQVLQQQQAAQAQQKAAQQQQLRQQQILQQQQAAQGQQKAAQQQQLLRQQQIQQQQAAIAAQKQAGGAAAQQQQAAALAQQRAAAAAAAAKHGKPVVTPTPVP